MDWWKLSSRSSFPNPVKCLYVLELTVGFESNLNNNAVRKKEKYLNLINKMSRNYRCVRFVNLSMSSLGVFSNECSTSLDMMNDIGIDKKHQHINIAIRATYYIFCCINRNCINAILILYIQYVAQYPDTWVEHCNNFPLLLARALKFGPEKIYLVLHMRKDSLTFLPLFLSRKLIFL